MLLPTMHKKYRPMLSLESNHFFIQYHARSKPSLIVPPTDRIGIYRFGNIANMGQIPLEFEFLTTGTSETKRATTIQVRSQASGLDKRQATVQAIIFRDGISRLVVFRGKGTKLLATEKHKWDKRVVVDFQDNAWVGEKVMLRWLQD